jgi:hypothetical protein
LFGRGRRKAWCEISGGHHDILLGSWAGHERAHAIRLHCDRCERETGWVRVPDPPHPSRNNRERPWQAANTNT